MFCLQICFCHFFPSCLFYVIDISRTFIHSFSVCKTITFYEYTFLSKVFLFSLSQHPFMFKMPYRFILHFYITKQFWQGFVYNVTKTFYFVFIFVLFFLYRIKMLSLILDSQKYSSFIIIIVWNSRNSCRNIATI